MGAYLWMQTLLTTSGRRIKPLREIKTSLHKMACIFWIQAILFCAEFNYSAAVSSSLSAAFFLGAAFFATGASSTTGAATATGAASSATV